MSDNTEPRKPAKPSDAKFVSFTYDLSGPGGPIEVCNISLIEKGPWAPHEQFEGRKVMLEWLDSAAGPYGLAEYRLYELIRRYEAEGWKVTLHEVPGKPREDYLLFEIVDDLV